MLVCSFASASLCVIVQIAYCGLLQCCLTLRQCTHKFCESSLYYRLLSCLKELIIIGHQCVVIHIKLLFLASQLRVIK